MACGDVVIHELRADDGEVVATELDMGVGRRLAFYQAGRRTEREWRAAGSVLKADVIEWAIDEGFEEYDLLRGDESYKSDWATERRELIRGPVRRRAAGIAVDAAQRAWRSTGITSWLRDRVRAARSATPGGRAARRTGPNVITPRSRSTRSVTSVRIGGWTRAETAAPTHPATTISDHARGSPLREKPDGQGERDHERVPNNAGDQTSARWRCTRTSTMRLTTTCRSVVNTAAVIRWHRRHPDDAVGSDEPHGERASSAPSPG